MLNKFLNFKKIVFCIIVLILLLTNQTIFVGAFFLPFAIAVILYVIFRQQATLWDRGTMGILLMLLVFTSIQIVNAPPAPAKTEFKNGGELYDYINNKNYKDLVKKWGEPDYKSDVWDSQGGLGSVDDWRIKARWNHIKVNECNNIEIWFKVILYSWGEEAPFETDSYQCN